MRDSAVWHTSDYLRRSDSVTVAATILLPAEDTSHAWRFSVALLLAMATIGAAEGDSHALLADLAGQDTRGVGGGFHDLDR